MGDPIFMLQIVDRRGRVVVMPGGGPLERDLIEACVRKVSERKVGLFKTQSQVEQAVREAVEAAIYELKFETRHVV